MSFCSELDLLWKSIHDNISGSLRGELKRAGTIPVQAARRAWSEEARKWDDSMTAYYAYRNKMQKRAPECAKKFQAALAGFCFRPVKPKEAPSKGPYLLGTAGLMAAGAAVSVLVSRISWFAGGIRYLLTRFTHLSEEHLLAASAAAAAVIGALLFGAVGRGLMSAMWEAKKEEGARDLPELYLAQLEILYQELLAVCREADSHTGE